MFPRYAAFLRGVTPMNAKMADLAKAFEAAGFENVRTVLGSGNVLFRAAGKSESSLEKAAEAAMKKRLGKEFPAIVRSVDFLDQLLEADPFRSFKLASDSKRIVTFLRARPDADLELPSALDGARILRVQDREVFTAYVPSPKGPVFMRLIEKTFGRDVTTPTWDTVKKVAAAAGAREQSSHPCHG